jgi:hypothetical protein
MLARVTRAFTSRPMVRNISVGTVIPTADMKFVKGGVVHAASTDSVFKGKKVRQNVCTAGILTSHSPRRLSWWASPGHLLALAMELTFLTL